MGIFDSFRKKKSEESPREMRRETPPRREETAPGRWQIADKILDRYEIRDIKYGGMGIVYVALDHEWNQMFAIKTFQDKFLWDENAIDRFMNEAETWVNLERHTNIVFSNFVRKIEGKPYIFLEYVDGGDLSKYVGKLDIPHTLDLAIQFCNGMDYAYKQLKVIHRDIKPENAMVTAEGILKVTDFGLVKAVGQRIMGEELEQVTPVVSRGMGTPVYMPPEQFPEEIQRKFHFKPREVTQRSDIYSFGVTYYEVLTGHRPFSSIKQIFTQNPINPAILNPDVPSQLDLLIMKCLEKDSRDRKYKDFEELMGELVEIYDTLPREQKVFGEIYTIKGKKEPLTAADWSRKGLSLMAVGKPQQAIVCLDRALHAGLNNASVWHNKGGALRDLGRHKEAISCYDRALDIDPKFTLSWINKGHLIKELGKHQEAIACYDMALKINPKLAAAWCNKGHIMLELGKSREAIACYDRALNIEPRLADAWIGKADTLLEPLGKYNEAIACYDRGLELDPRQPEALYRKALALAKLGRHRDAVEPFRKFVTLAPPQYSDHIREAEEYIRFFEQNT